MSHDHMRQASTVMVVAKDNSKKLKHLDLSGGNKTTVYLPKTAYQLELKCRGKLCRSNSNLNPSPFVAVNCDNGKAMRKEKFHRTRLERLAKNSNIELRQK